MAETEQQQPAGEPIKIKKYANRRLYNTATSSYVTLDHLALMVREGKDFIVHDAKTNEDITRSVLTQIIFEEEQKGQALLPISFLRQIIGFYGDSLQHLVPGYLEASMSAFQKNQDEMRTYVSKAFGDMFPLQGFEEVSRQNMQMFQRAMAMFNPFAGGPPGTSPFVPPAPAKEGKPDDLADLKAKLQSLEKQLDTLAKK